MAVFSSMMLKTNHGSIFKYDAQDEDLMTEISEIKKGKSDSMWVGQVLLEDKPNIIVCRWAKESSPYQCGDFELIPVEIQEPQMPSISYISKRAVVKFAWEPSQQEIQQLIPNIRKNRPDTVAVVTIAPNRKFEAYYFSDKI
ncbi:hypothetical protein [Nodularia sp. UHCC 0506]|uniref:hypothetical protein n=1 Tax=Nodularia sp. UHCC 0506 TaxID=3110243 RepID=UPI002B21475D|nr:hypothetical protein [Nodularia sp. UHCC 0506]MEA5513100.1 hypothetical protein [Nodularia sp. UHCC 0506]